MSLAPGKVGHGVAHGRLDLMGGVGDYSGCHVLEAPIRLATTVTVEVVVGDAFELASGRFGTVRVPRTALFDESTIRPVSSVREALAALGVPRWVSYPLGCLATFVEAHSAIAQLPAEFALRIEVESAVPHSMGVSSSASVEVATMRALEALFEAPMDPIRRAHVAQRAENLVVGAPCGLMDQLSVSVGVPGALMPIECRPDHCLAPVRLPRGVVAVGWPSGVKHDVGASPYLKARTATFMAKKIVEVECARVLASLNPDATRRTVPDVLQAWTGVGATRHGPSTPVATAVFEASSSSSSPSPSSPSSSSSSSSALPFLATLSPSFVEIVAVPHVPESIRGADFLARYGNPDDALSVVEPEEVYPIHAPLRFVAGEDQRVRSAIAFFESLERVESLGDEDAAGTARALGPTILTLVGELMLEGHAGYTGLGLGCPETDAMVVALMRELGPARGVYGARVSGGGSGGTVAILCREDALPSIAALAAEERFRFDRPAGEPFPGLIV